MLLKFSLYIILFLNVFFNYSSLARVTSAIIMMVVSFSSILIKIAFHVFGIVVWELRLTYLIYDDLLVWGSLRLASNDVFNVKESIR